jgi:CubicO group peptidase (beta-lactamase class C family)
LRLISTLLLGLLLLQSAGSAEDLTFSLLERYLESLRQEAGVPGMSAAILQGRRIVWERGFGFQDVEDKIAATPSTPYPVSDLSQTFAAVLLLQCVEDGELDLEDPIRRWTAMIPEAGATLGDVATHASPAGRFSYDPSRYAALTPVVEECGGRQYRRLLADRILDRLGMTDSVPGHDLLPPSSAARQTFSSSELDDYASTMRRLATPYKVDRRGRATRSDYPGRGPDASFGIVSTVRDLGRYDAALNDRVLLDGDSLRSAWTNAVSASGNRLPSGVGWFVQDYHGERLVWHFGLIRDAYSSLILKAQGRGLTLILLANSDGLSAPFDLDEGDVTSSLFARVFLRLFL